MKRTIKSMNLYSWKYINSNNLNAKKYFSDCIKSYGEEKFCFKHLSCEVNMISTTPIFVLRYYLES